jgi:hypothetical protein
MSDDVTKVVRSLFEAFNEGDLERAAAAAVSDVFELVDVAAGQTFRGPDGCCQWLEIFQARPRRARDRGRLRMARTEEGAQPTNPSG